jgi:hypothetical protein
MTHGVTCLGTKRDGRARHSCFAYVTQQRAGLDRVVPLDCAPPARAKNTPNVAPCGANSCKTWRHTPQGAVGRSVGVNTTTTNRARSPAAIVAPVKVC